MIIIYRADKWELISAPQDLNEEKYLSDDETDQVLLELGGSDYVYEQIGEIIDDEVRRVRKQNQ